MSGLSLFIPAVQILYVSERQHWLTVSYLNDDLKVYDSICGSKFTTSVELQIASSFASASQGDSLVATVVPVQQQLGEVDCGLFAAAFAFHAAKGDTLRRLQFDQSRMRSHLIQCFEEHKLEGFPLSSCHPDQLNRTKLAHRVIRLYCTCRMPEAFDTKMVACDTCEKWFHYKCVGIKKRARLATWVCRTCN